MRDKMEPPIKHRLNRLRKIVKEKEEMGFCKTLVNKGLMYCHYKCPHWEETFCSKNEKWQGFLEAKTPTEKREDLIFYGINAVLIILGIVYEYDSKRVCICHNFTYYVLDTQKFSL
jgi:hypothetical protein